MARRSVITVLGFYVLQQDEIGVRLSLGKYSGEVHPGLGFAIPLIQKIYKTQSSLQTIDLPEQQIVLNGNISVSISGNLNFRVASPAKALLEVSNYRYTIQQLAMTTISDVLGTKTIEDVRNEKVKIANEVEAIVSRSARDWGLANVDIRLTDARLDDGLQRAMMRETEAEKEANAIKIKAESDKYVSQIFADAATTLAGSPGAMTLRVLQTLSDVSNDKSTVVIPVPVDMLTRAQPVVGVPTPDAASEKQSISPHVPEYPVAEIQTRGEKTIAICPSCQAKFNVSSILNDKSFDQDLEVPGVQLKCKRCETMFTVPET